MDDRGELKRRAPRILVVDDEASLCASLADVLASDGMVVHSQPNPCLVLETLRQTSYDLILLDVAISPISGLGLLAQIRPLYPDTKIIMMTAYADKEKVLDALRLGAFDFLEKPIALDLLSHAAQRALHLQAVERAHTNVMAELQRSQRELLARQAQLEQLNREFLETNQALAVIARHIDRTRQETEAQMIQDLRARILPILKGLQREPLLTQYQAQLAMLEEYITTLTAGLATDLQVTTMLSFGEWRVASLIQQGLTSEAIAAHLHIALDTVKTHRRNIRRKLQLVGGGNSLKAYLGALACSPSPPNHSRKGRPVSNGAVSHDLRATPRASWPSAAGR
jgi:DNA-binding NarL/FixJ family response regulator